MPLAPNWKKPGGDLLAHSVLVQMRDLHPSTEA
jgi:hypothetical protein